MPNESRLWRYEVSTSNNAVRRHVFVRADISASSLASAGVVNAEPAAVGVQNTLRIVLQGRGGRKAKISHARTVTVVMTEASPPLSIGSRAVIPIFREDRFEQFQVGGVASYLGRLCRIVDKADGSPDINGN